MKLIKHLKCGISKRKVEELTIQATISEKTDRKFYEVSYSVTGLEFLSKTLEEDDLFSAVTIGIAGLRQSLRIMLEQNPKLKFYEERQNELIELSFEDIFWIHDCTNED